MYIFPTRNNERRSQFMGHVALLQTTTIDSEKDGASEVEQEDSDVSVFQDSMLESGGDTWPRV